jgi:hypothetical protein
MQIKNIISFIFLSQSVISFPRRNRNRGGTGVEDSVSSSTVSSTVSSSTVSSSTVSSSTVSSTDFSFPTNLCTC